jgi:hypothetical protein
VRRTFVAGLVAASLALGASTAFAVPNEKASCVGLGSQFLGSVQQRDEIAALIRQVAALQGVPSGHLYADFAKLHEGNFVACEAAEAGG